MTGFLDSVVELFSSPSPRRHPGLRIVIAVPRPGTYRETLTLTPDRLTHGVTRIERSQIAAQLRLLATDIEKL